MFALHFEFITKNDDANRVGSHRGGQIMWINNQN
jgi:hypothetical protein